MDKDSTKVHQAFNEEKIFKFAMLTNRWQPVRYVIVSGFELDTLNSRS